MRSLYKIYANKILIENDWTKMLNMTYNGLYSKPYNNTISFDNKPTVQEVIDVLKLLLPDSSFDIDSIKIEFVRELTQREL